MAEDTTEKKKSSVLSTISKAVAGIGSALAGGTSSDVSSSNTSTSDGTSSKSSSTSFNTSPYTTSSTSSSKPTTTYQEDLDKLSQAQLKSQIQSLKEARDKTLQSLDEEEAKVGTTYQNARNSTTATSLKNAKSFNEYLANRGLTNSGSSAQAELNRTSNLNNNLASIDQNEVDAYNDINSRRTEANTTYNNGVASAKAGIDATYYQNLLNNNQTQREYYRNLAQQAVGQYSNDYQAYMNTLDPNSDEYLWASAARGNKVQNNLSAAQSNALASIQSGVINYNNAAALGWTIPEAQAYYEKYEAQNQATIDAENEQKAYERSQDAWEREYKEKQLANETALNNYKINEPYSSNNSNNESSNGISTSAINTIINNLQSNYGANDTAGKLNYINLLRDTGGLGTGEAADDIWRALYKSIFSTTTTNNINDTTSKNNTQNTTSSGNSGDNEYSFIAGVL